MNQTTFSDIEYSGRKSITKRKEFLDTMEEIIPWSEWVKQYCGDKIFNTLCNTL